MRLTITLTLAIFHFVLMGQTWGQKASLPAIGRLAGVAFTIGGKGYLGIGNTYNGFADDFWEYDPITDSWTQKANFVGGPRNFALGFAIGNKGYFSCGHNGITGTYQNDFWEYDPGTNAWTQKANLGGVIRVTASGFSVAGYGYIGTGFDSNGTCLSDFWRYDPATNSWAQMGNFPGGKRVDVDRATFVIGNKAYWGTGWDQNATPSVKYNDLWEYDSPTDTWTQKANIPTLGRWGAIGFSLCNKGFIGLGTYSGISIPYNDFWQYDPTTNFWTSATFFPMAGRTEASVVVINNKAYIGSGMDTSLTFYNNQYYYTIYSDWWEFSMGASVSVSAIPDTICQGSSTTIIATGGNSYSWNTGATTSSIVVSPTATTSYSAIDPTSSCASAGNITIVVLQSSSATISGSTSICAGNSATLTASGGGTYSWIPGGQTTPTIIVSPSTTATYSSVVTNMCGTATVSATVAIVSGITASFSGNTLLCAGQTTTLTASGGNIFNWSTGATTSSIIITPSSNTSYSVSVSSGSCSDDTSISVTVSPPPTASASNATICNGDVATLTASGGGNYLWSNGATTSFITASVAGNYSVVVSIGNCSDTASANLIVNPAPTANAGSNVTITQGVSATLSATGGGTYNWNNGNTDAAITVSPNATTMYCVTVANANGCVDSACVSVFVMVPIEPVDCSSSSTGELFLPNAFSPYGDGENDVIKIYFGNMQCIKAFRLLIYNRWGEKVFETFEPVSEWDGSYRGQTEGNFVFAYYMKAILMNGEEVIKKGNISLMK